MVACQNRVQRTALYRVVPCRSMYSCTVVHHHQSCNFLQRILCQRVLWCCGVHAVCCCCSASLDSAGTRSAKERTASCIPCLAKQGQDAGRPSPAGHGSQNRAVCLKQTCEPALEGQARWGLTCSSYSTPFNSRWLHTSMAELLSQYKVSTTRFVFCASSSWPRPRTLRGYRRHSLSFFPRWQQQSLPS